MCSTAYAVEDGPRAPCGSAPNPAYAEVGAQPNVKVWREEVHVASDCVKLPAGKFKTVLALSGAFRFEGNADKLLERIGAVSKMRGIRYWSVTDGKWRELITQSVAVAGAGEPAQRRGDFSVAEMKKGADLFFAQHDSRSTGEVVYRMRVLEAGKDRVVVETENISPVKTYVFTAFKPGALRAVHYLTRKSPDVWTAYSLTLIGSSQSEGHIPSLENRALALYRYIAGQKTDQEPPLAQ